MLVRGGVTQRLTIEGGTRLAKTIASDGQYNLGQ
jgi:hypothetical protein